MKFKYKPDGEVLKSFMRDDTFFRGIRGPVGSGKSVACCVEVFRRALQQEKNSDGKRKSRWAIVRNTNPHLSKRGSIGFPKISGVSSRGLCHIRIILNRVTLSLR